MFDALSDRLERISSRLKGRGRLSPQDLEEAIGEIRTALLEADVALSVVTTFTEGMKARLTGAALAKSLTPDQQVIKAVREELVALLGGTSLKVTYASRPPTVILLAGLQGAGKTTTAAKLARWFKAQGKDPYLVGADLQRPAAVEQLGVLAKSIGVGMFSQPSDPVAVAKAGLAEATRLGRDVCIVDTAGRLAVDASLMAEVAAISKAIKPNYTFFVVDAMTGQDAADTAVAFNAALSLDGVIITKLDGDARGGAALSVLGVVGKPIVFASTGEKIADFDLFHPDRMADRILGMGDVLSLIEQAQSTMDRGVVERSAERIMEGYFTFDDFLDQLRQVKKMGSIGGIMKHLPGMPKEMKNAAANIDEGHLNRVEAIVCSMTKGERSNPSILDGSRRQRIARGSGTTITDVNQVIKQFTEMAKMMKGLAQGKMPGMGQIPGMGQMMKGAPALSGMGGLGGLGLPGAKGALSGLGDLGLDRGALLGGAASGAPSGGGGKGKKKKKGGRVTPPKPR